MMDCERSAPRVIPPGGIDTDMTDLTPPDLLTLPAAAKLAGLSPYRIRAALEAGDLLAFDVSTGTERKHVRIDKEDLIAFVSRLRADRAH